MAMSFVKRTDFPTAPKGKSAGPSVSVTESGQVVFNSGSATHWGGRDVTKVAIALDKESGQFAIYPSTHKQVVKAKLTDNQMYAVRYTNPTNKKGAKQALAATISAMSPLLRERGYDYKASGQQSFSVELLSEGVVSFTLPAGKLTPKPKVERKKRTTTAPATAPAASAATAGANGSAATESSDELVLE